MTNRARHALTALRVALYARYSTDMQDPESIKGQFRNCEQRAEREGWKIVARYSDPGISGGTRMRERPDGARLLLDAEAHKFDILLVDDLSRAFRHPADQIDTLDLLRYHKVHVVSVSDGVDTRHEGHELSTGVKGIINAEYRKDIAKKVHRQLSLKAANGKNAGGCPYGYKIIYETVTDDKGRASSRPVARVVDPQKAKWVRFIFEKYAHGTTPVAIASELNRLKVPSPGSSWKRSVRRCRGWMGSGIVSMLGNPLYIGKQVWNRSKWVDIPDEVKRRKGLTGRKQRVERPESEWIVTEAPKLRIVQQDIWNTVQEKRRERAAMQTNQQSDQRSAQKYPWSGILKCATCGANFIIANRYAYRCSTNKGGGNHSCSNNLLVKRQLLEEKLFQAIKQDLFSKEALERARRRLIQMQAERRKTRKPDLEAAQRDLGKVETEIKNIVSAIRAGAFSPALKSELEGLEAERDRLHALLKVNPREADKVVQLIPDLMERYAAIVEDIANVRKRDVARIRAQLKTLVGGQVLLHPTDEGYLEAELAGNYAGLIKLALGKTSLNLHGSGGRI